MAIVTTYKNSYAVYQMTPFSMTLKLSDPTLDFKVMTSFNVAQLENRTRQNNTYNGADWQNVVFL